MESEDRIQLLKDTPIYKGQIWFGFFYCLLSIACYESKSNADYIEEQLFEWNFLDNRNASRRRRAYDRELNPEFYPHLVKGAFSAQYGRI